MVGKLGVRWEFTERNATYVVGLSAAPSSQGRHLIRTTIWHMFCWHKDAPVALGGNWTVAMRMTDENPTTEPHVHKHFDFV